MAVAGLALLAATQAQAAISCARTVTANIVAFDKPLMFNRLGASNINGTMFALKRDVVNIQSQLPLTAGGAAVPGNLDLRPDKRPRPIVLRVREGDCLTVNLTNLLTAAPNPRQLPNPSAQIPANPTVITSPSGQQLSVQIDDAIMDRAVSFNSSGMQLVDSIDSDGSYVGANTTDAYAAANGGTRTYKLFAEKPGVFNVSSVGGTFGSDGNMGVVSMGLFGQVIVEPAGAKIYRSQVFEEELRLATTGTTGAGQPIINYEVLYPNNAPWTLEGKAGLPVLNMICTAAAAATGKCLLNEIVHSEINAVIAGSNADGTFPASTYPLESKGKRNPTLPNRLEPFRDFASVYHDETSNGQAFPGFYSADPVFKYVLAGVKDAFMINYGSGGIGSEIIASRLSVGPMHDCLHCSYEEFFLTSFTVGDPAITVDVPANLGLEALLPGQIPAPGTQGPKANYVIGAEDPANIHHSYIGDFAKFRNTHHGKEQHIFHLHNHQWLYNPNDDNSNYQDAQGIGPGVGYTYEINFGGSGNRNKSAGDAIFHCHFYPHFAQGMWYHWRNNDTLQTGTILAATPTTLDGDGFARATGYHTALWGLGMGKPAPGSRAYPDGEIVAGTPIPALVPLPGKPMPVMPGRVTTRVNPLMAVTNPAKHTGSLATVIDRDLNPGFPFWIAGVEDTIGQRPPTPVLDMLSKTLAATLKATNEPLWQQLMPDQADGFDGGLPRHSLKGLAVGGVAATTISRFDFSKDLRRTDVVFYPEEGTDLEKVSMAFHSLRCHDTFKPDGTLAACTGGDLKTPLSAAPRIFGRVSTQASTATGGFITNGGGGPVVGAPFHNPCMDDRGVVLKPGVTGKFFSGEVNATNFTTGAGLLTQGSSFFNSVTPRIYKGTNMQFDAVLNKAGYHYPQQRIVALWQDVEPVIRKNKPAEPLVMRNNTFDCTIYHHSNLVPGYYELDDYQVRTPTDIISQHIHLPKWDLTTTDGAANGWNYEDGTYSPQAVRERINAINCFNGFADACHGGVGPGPATGKAKIVAQDHPYWGKVANNLGGKFPEQWRGARTTMGRWFFDPVVNTEGVDRGLGIIFTHDHYGPSSHQQLGLYSTVLAEPAGSKWAHNETGAQLGYDPLTGAPARTDTMTVNGQTVTFSDGGPTSWQAAILPQAQTGPYAGNTVKAGVCTADRQVTGVDCQRPFREFYLEFTDFQHAYEAGVYVGADQQGLPFNAESSGLPPTTFNYGNPLWDGTAQNAFRFAINPPGREQITPVFPDLVVELAQTARGPNDFCPVRPCPTAISVQDPGMLTVNYRSEPVALRVYDPNKPGPDAAPGKDCSPANPNRDGCGMQADGLAGDLAYALQSRTDRKIAAMNVQPTAATVINGTRFPPPINHAGVNPGDPFTPMMRTYAGDFVRIKIQSGGNEEEHNTTIHGLKWLFAGAGHGQAKNSGWRNGQASGISEQFTLAAPVTADMGNGLGNADYAWSVDAGNDGWWSGMWGLMRNYTLPRNDLFQLPGKKPQIPANLFDFALPAAERAQQGNTLFGACPTNAPRRNYDLTVVLANKALTNALGVTLPITGDIATRNVGDKLDPAGGTLVYNHRNSKVSGTTIDDVTGAVINVTHEGPLHDPTAIMYVRTSDLDANGKLLPTAPVEPVVLRARAGECINVTLRNKLPALVPDLATYSTLQGIVKRNRFQGLNGVEGSTRFDNNLIRASSHVGLHPQLVEYDVTRNDGTNVGANPVQTVAPGGVRTYQWYAGDLGLADVSGNPLNALIDLVRVVPTPVEFGGVNLTPADKIKQGAKSLVGAMVIEPRNATWTEDTQVLDHQDGVGTRLTRAQATVCPAGPTNCAIGSANAFRDFSLVLTKANTHYYKDGSPVEHMNGEGVGIPEDSQEASGMALNYGIEPMWFRYGILPQAPFGNVAVPGSYGAVANSHAAYSNTLTLGQDPVTPVFVADAGKPARVRITNPHGTTRGSTFQAHGHVWQRDPYVCPGEARNGLTGACNMSSVGSRAIGTNPIAFYEGGRESWTPMSHFDVVLPSAGGGNAVKGDYLIRDGASFGNASGLWNILRVK